MHRFNWFLTLTYREVPPGGSLRPKDLQDFWKRVRKSYPGVRYFACGEYGEEFARPHYHALAFNLQVPMKRRTRLHDDQVVFESDELERLWGHGHVDVGEFSPAAAQYVCNYVRKKVGAVRAADRGLEPEFQVMSRRPGIGAPFITRFFRDVYPDGYVTRQGGTRRRAPRYYDSVLERTDGKMFRAVKRKRVEAAEQDPDRSGRAMIRREEYEAGKNRFFDGAKGRRFEKGELR